MDPRDIRLLQCYLGPVSRVIFDSILKTHMETIFKGELEKEGISREYQVIYDLGNVKDTTDGKNYDRNVAYVYTKDPRFSCKLAGCDYTGGELYREISIDFLDNERDYSVFEELFDIPHDQIDFAPMAEKEKIMISKERVFPPNPKCYMVPESEKSLHPPGSSGRTNGTFDFILKTSKLRTPSDGEEQNMLIFDTDDGMRKACALISSSYSPVISGKTVTFKDPLDAARIMTAMGKTRTVKYVRKNHSSKGRESGGGYRTDRPYKNSKPNSAGPKGGDAWIPTGQKNASRYPKK